MDPRARSHWRAWLQRAAVQTANRQQKNLRI
jgi:hypothetical protein